MAKMNSLLELDGLSTTSKTRKHEMPTPSRLNQSSESPLSSPLLSTTSSAEVENCEGDALFARHEEDLMRIVEWSPKGRYGRYDDRLGTGASKAVYLAVDINSGRHVAWNSIDVRSLTPDEQRRVRDENFIGKELSHKNLLKYMDCWVRRKNEKPCELVLITELATGGSLRHYLKNLGTPVKRRAIKVWCRQILEGLDYLHTRDPSIIHRDIKCDNIFVNSNTGDLKIGDLGLSKELRTSCATSVVGTLEFMAPECLQDKYGSSCDIYSFGLTVFEMVARRMPYHGLSQVQVMTSKAKGAKPELLQDILDLDVVQFVSKCIDTNPAARPSAATLLKDPFLQPSEIDDVIVEMKPSYDVPEVVRKFSSRLTRPETSPQRSPSPIAQAKCIFTESLPQPTTQFSKLATLVEAGSESDTDSANSPHHSLIHNKKYENIMSPSLPPPPDEHDPQFDEGNEGTVPSVLRDLIIHVRDVEGKWRRAKFDFYCETDTPMALGGLLYERLHTCNALEHHLTPNCLAQAIGYEVAFRLGNAPQNQVFPTIFSRQCQASIDENDQPIDEVKQIRTMSSIPPVSPLVTATDVPFHSYSESSSTGWFNSDVPDIEVPHETPSWVATNDETVGRISETVERGSETVGRISQLPSPRDITSPDIETPSIRVGSPISGVSSDRMLIEDMDNHIIKEDDYKDDKNCDKMPVNILRSSSTNTQKSEDEIKPSLPQQIVNNCQKISTAPMTKWVSFESCQDVSGDVSSLPILLLNIKDPHVKFLQNALSYALLTTPEELFGSSCDHFGQKTCDAVKTFQATAKIKVDGIVGRVTWGILKRFVAERRLKESEKEFRRNEAKLKVQKERQLKRQIQSNNSAHTEQTLAHSVFQQLQQPTQQSDISESDSSLRSGGTKSLATLPGCASTNSASDSISCSGLHTASSVGHGLCALGIGSIYPSVAQVTSTLSNPSITDSLGKVKPAISSNSAFSARHSVACPSAQRLSGTTSGHILIPPAPVVAGLLPSKTANTVQNSVSPPSSVIPVSKQKNVEDDVEVP
eukprot:GHVL01041190.1.p1 GENE.GHVL01041190.1~~GHVL01041190.1.p1  ORF type:complete len:1039 (+),score=252.12 GHVL01041190.1:152-3268(+)